jgi:hypothetical protein
LRYGLLVGSGVGLYLRSDESGESDDSEDCESLLLLLPLSGRLFLVGLVVGDRKSVV